MNTKVYTFLLGMVLSTAVFALVSFKHEEKEIEKEQMIIIAKGTGRSYELCISTANEYNYSKVEVPTDYLSYSSLLGKVQEYQKMGWVITNSNLSSMQVNYTVYYTLEREKK